MFGSGKFISSPAFHIQIKENNNRDGQIKKPSYFFQGSRLNNIIFLIRGR
jgi:hypothetical protein